MAETYHPRGELVDGYPPREHPVYTRWANMKDRCNNYKKKPYVNYGGRGITYCERWKHFANFAKDMGIPPTPEHTLERRDNSRGYSPDNCYWADRTAQCHNRRIFTSNTSGYTGVVATDDGRWNARWDDRGVRYNLGKFGSAEEAHAYREKFLHMLETDPVEAMALVGRRARYDSATGIRGITKHKSGYTVRVTDRGVRVYLGHATDLASAIKKLWCYHAT